MLKKIQMTVCPNPKCQKKFECLVIVHDNSKTPAEIYYACPHCMFKLDPTAIQVLRKEEIFLKEKTNNKQAHPKKEIPSGCCKYLGYLSDRPKEIIIPQECLICTKMLDCTLKNNNPGK